MNHSSVRLNYNRMSRFYDLFAGTSERSFSNRGLRMLAVQPGEIVLEIGFGTGHSLVALANAVGPSGKVIGVDISEGMLQVARSRLHRTGPYEQVDLRLGDASCLPFETGVFDVVFASFTLELFDNLEIPIVLREWYRMLRINGRIGIVALAKRNRMAVKIYELAHTRFPELIDCHPIQVSDVIETAGFQISEVEYRSMWGLPVEIVVARKSS